MKNPFNFLLVVLLFVSCSGKDGFTPIKTNDSSAWNFTGQVTKTTEEITLTATGAKSITTSSFKDFALEFECKTSPGAIGSVQFHTDGFGTEIEGYEVLINNNEEPVEWRKTGSLSTVRNFGKCVAENDTWVPIRIEVNDINIRVFVNGLWIVDYYEPEKPYRLPEYKKRILSDGVFILENYSEAPISFRNIKVKLLDRTRVSTSLAMNEQNDEIIKLSQINFPTIDEHVHLKGGLTKDDLAALSRKYGITYGVSPNCGKNFPIQNDDDIEQWLDTMKNTPFLLAMQAEGREWLEMFSTEAMNKFDYRFTDALTWTDDMGRRMRIWIPEETFVDDDQQFMDMLVDRAYTIISTEPIDIYVNPTFLPEQLMDDYDYLWTRARMEKVIDACINNNVAIEINCRYHIPSKRFIQLAKNKGAKFTIGTNNEGAHDIGKLEYATEMIKACKLTTEDIWIPTSRNR